MKKKRKKNTKISHFRSRKKRKKKNKTKKQKKKKQKQKKKNQKQKKNKNKKKKRKKLNCDYVVVLFGSVNEPHGGSSAVNACSKPQFQLPSCSYWLFQSVGNQLPVASCQQPVTSIYGRKY